MGEKKIRISEELYEQIQKVAEKSGRSMRELVEEAVKAYLLGTENIDKPVKSVSGKIIPVQYETRCRLCGKRISKGELAYWVKYVYNDNTTKSYVICLDCYYKDTALAEWYLKKKKLESIVRGLKKEADRLADEVEKLRTEYSILNLKKEIYSVWNDFKNFILRPHHELNDDKLNEFIEKINELIDRVSSIEASLRIEIESRRKAKKIKVLEE